MGGNLESPPFISYICKMRKKRKSNKTRSDLSTKQRKITARKKAKARVTAIVKSRNAGQWTEAEYFQRIRSSLRRTFRFWKPMMIALEKASRPNQSANKRLKREFQCNHCKLWFKRTDVQIDHIEECGSLSKYGDLVPFLERLTRESPDSFQVLCKPCHVDKTKLYKETKKAKT